MNYLVACDRFVKDSPGGAYHIAWELAKLAKREGHQVALLCATTPLEASAGRALIDGVEVVRYLPPVSHPLDPRRMFRHIESARQAVRNYLGDRRWDVVHAHTLLPGIAAFQSAGKCATRIATAHSPAVLEQRIIWNDGSLRGQAKLILGEPLLRSTEASLYASAHRVSVLSNYTKRELGLLFGPRLSEMATQIPWWSEPAHVRSMSKAAARIELGWPQDAPVLFSLRRLVPRMGLDTLIDAVGLIAERSAPPRVFIGGEGPIRPELEKNALTKGVDRAVTFLGRLTDEQRALAYQAADLFVLPTLALECFGIIALEALAYGCPLVASRVGAIPEVVEPVLPTSLVSPGDARQLADKISEFLSNRMPFDPETLARYAASKYSKERVASAYLEFITGAPSQLLAS